MISMLAIDIATVAVSVPAVAGYIDTQLQEIRLVLTKLAPRTNVDEIGHCWCSKNLTDDKEPHDKTCQLTRALWQKLQPTTEQTVAQVRVRR